jgi:hypothetical protein
VKTTRYSSFLAALMSAWLGAALLTAASVAPAAFAVFTSRSAAGDLVGRVLAVIFMSGFVAGAVAMVLTPVPARAERWAAFVAALMCLITRLVVMPHIAGIRANVRGPIDALPESDPQRVEFAQLHVISVAALGIAIIAAVVFVILTLRNVQRVTESEHD